jgi:hypothetical protein
MDILNPTAAVQIPYPQRSVIRRREDAAPVGRCRYGIDRVWLTGKDSPWTSDLECKDALRDALDKRQV